LNILLHVYVRINQNVLVYHFVILAYFMVEILLAYAVLPTLCKLECGPMPNLMVALPNTGGALCSTPQSLADAHY